MQVLADNTNLEMALTLGWTTLCIAAMVVIVIVQKRFTYLAAMPVLLSPVGLLVIGHLFGADMTGLLFPFAMLGISWVFIARAWIRRDSASNREGEPR